jgi:hypothetical protein
MPEIKSHGKLFFKIMPAGCLSRANHLAHPARKKSLVVREIIRPEPRWGSQRVIAVSENAIPMARPGLFIGRNDRSTPRGQTKDQSPVGGDTNDATAHRTTTAM